VPVNGLLGRQVLTKDYRTFHPDPMNTKNGEESLSDTPNLHQQWPAPTGRDYRSDEHRQTDEDLYGTKGKPLSREAATWKAPHGFANTDAAGKTAGAAGEMAKQAVTWNTPRSHETGEYNYQKNGDITPSLTGQAAQLSGKKKLNPLFVCWLMGYPIHYLSHPERINYEDWETQSRHSLARLLSLYSQSGLVSPHGTTNQD
jgi:hypothetical protein